MPNLRGANRPTAISVGGSAEPIEPVYTKPNHSASIGSPYATPSEPISNLRAPIVMRGQDTRGMRYLWADMHQRQPISPLGTGPDIGNAVWSSEFQPSLGSLRDYGFYDLLYRAGYPGFNLGVSFRVPVNPSVGGQGPGAGMHMNSPNKKVVVNVFKRVSAAASMRG